MKTKIQIIGLLLFCLLAIASNIVIETTSEESITPLSLLIIPLFNVPEDVHSIYGEIQLSNTLGNDSLPEQIKKKHSAYYPILVNTNGQAFSVLHFSWMIGPEHYSDVESLEVKVKDCRVSINYSFDDPLKSYTKLLNVIPESEKNERTVTQFISSNEPHESFRKNENKNQKAIIFVHGLLRGGYNTILKNFKDNKASGWHNAYLKDYWKNYYDFKDVDYYEFVYDSYFHSAKYYGEKLTDLLYDSGILEQYQELIMISYSMGTLVARYAVNTKLNDSDEYLGEKIKKVILINGVLEGSYFTNLVDPLLTKLSVSTIPHIHNICHNCYDTVYLYKILDLLYNLEDFIFEADFIVEFLDNFMQLYELNPLIASVLFICFSDIPFIGGQVVPFEGMNSMKYTSEKFLRNLERAYGFSEGVYLGNPDLQNLNEDDRFKDKYTFITSYIENAESTLHKVMSFSKNFHLQAILNHISDENTDFFSIPFVQFTGQRVLSLVFQRIGELAGDNVLHSQNDGFVSLWSQQLTGHHSTIKVNDVYVLKNLDHAQIKDDPEVLDIIKKIVSQ